MATRKLGRGKGALRNVSSSSVPGSIASAAIRSGSPKSPCAVYSHQDQLLEVRVTGITDLTSFWVQMGTASQLEEFDMNSLQLSSWCSERGGGRISLPLVKDIIVVRDKVSGLQASAGNATCSSWSRAEVIKQVSDSQVEVLYVDTGSSGRVNLCEICREMPPKEMLMGLHRQAVHCFLHGVQLIGAQPEHVTERFRELVQLPSGSVRATKNFVTDAKSAAVTLYVQFEGSWFSVAEILKREGLVLYDPVCAISISDAGAMPSEGYASDDATPTRTPTHSRLHSSVGVPPDDGPTPVPSESSPLHFLPETPPLPSTSPTPQSSQVDEDQSDGPPSLTDGSSVDTDSSSLERKTDIEESEERSTIVTATSSGIPLLTISLPKFKGALISSMSSMAAVKSSQLKLPFTRDSMRKQTSSVDSSHVTPTVMSVQATAAPSSLADGEVQQASKLPASPSSPLPLSKSIVASEGQMNDKAASAISQPSTAGGVGQLQQSQLQDQQKPLVESSTCTEEDDDDDVIEIGEVESELDTSVGGGEGEEKGNSASADTISSDDEWDESLLPPSSDSSPTKNDVAEAAEYFEKVDMRSNRKLWAQNNSQKRSGAHHKNAKPFYYANNNNLGYQDQNKSSPAHNYHESLRRWGGYNSPIETQDMNNYNQGRPPPMWYSGVGRGRRARGSGGGGGGGPNRSMGRGRRGAGGGGGGQNRNFRRGWVEEYPRPHPPPLYMDGIQQSQLLRRPGMAGAGRGGVRDVANFGMGGGEFDGYQSAPPAPLTYPSYSGGIRQSQLVKQPSVSKPDFQRNSSSPSDMDNLSSPSPQQGTDRELQSEDRFTGGVMGSPSGCGQAPPFQPLPSSQNIGNLVGSGGSSGVYRGLTEEQIKNEVGWYTSAIERAVKKIVSSLTSSSTDQFASKILELLGDSKAQKLLSLSSLRTPLEVIMLSVVKGALEGEWNDDSSDVILTAIENLIDAAPHQACTFLQSSLVEVATEVSSSGGIGKTSQRFCSFLGRLFISASYSNKEDFSTAVGQAVKECLDKWCAISSEIPDFQKVAYAQCFSFLCDEIGPTIDDSSKDNLDAYFDKPVIENILNEKLSRQVREIILNLLIRRLNGWDGRKKVEPTTTPTPTTEAPPRQEATPTPTSLTPVPPPAVTDYPVKAQNTTDPSSSVVQPIPICAPRFVAGSVYQTGANVEVPMEYGSVRMLSPQPQASSVFMPTAAAPHHHQHPRTHRTLSLPNTLQQQAPTPSSSVRSASVSDVPADDPYVQITEMLNSLSLMDLLPRFEEFLIKDYILDCENENIKSCLQEASVPLGAVVGILDYIEKRRKSKKTSSSQQRSSTSGAFHQATPLHQMMPHPPIYSPPESISHSSTPTPAPPAAYLTQQFQQPESQFPVIGSQIQTESATPTPAHYSLASHYPQQSSQMKPAQFEQLPLPLAPQPSQFPTSPHDQNLQQQQQQFQYTQSQQLQQSQQVNTNVPQHQLVAPSSLPQHHLQYQQPSSPSQAQAQAQRHLPQKPPQQAHVQQVQAREAQPRLPMVSLPHSSLTGSSGASGTSNGGGGSVATSPTTAQRMVSLPASQRGPPSLFQLQSLRQSHSQTRQNRNTTPFSSSSHQSEPQSPAAAPPKPVGGFGTIMCVCCGAKDHKTPNCPQRKDFFF